MSSLSSPSSLFPSPLLQRPLLFSPSSSLRPLSTAIPKPSSPPPSAPVGARLSRRSRGRTITSCFPVPAAMERTAIAESSLSQETLSYARAYWVSRILIAWNINYDDDAYVYLYASRKASISLTEEGIEGYDVKILLEPEYYGLPANVTEKFPHIVNYSAFKISESVDFENLLKCQLAIAFYVDGKCKNATGLQLPGVLDDLFAYNGPLGAVFSKEAVTLHLWAPTAQEVSVCIYKEPSGGEPLESVQLEEFGGVWSAVGPKSWEGCYYVYEVSVYHPSTSQIEKCTVTDPYARGLSSNGKRTWLINLDSENLKPEGWDKLADEKPDLLSFSDISIYELHIRDFSASDHTVNCDIQGGYLAFTSQESAGICHLKKLSNAGLTHVHLLPSFHFAGVDDDKSNWKYLDDGEMAKLPADSDKQQAEVIGIQNEDGYNWGYNPVLWGVPKGSYAGNPNGPSRILEFRKMIQAVNRIGLRVVLDVVYNHLASSGPLNENSVLDKVVPGYYLRRNTDGAIENSACMNNTASEHFMVERLILDDLLNWAVVYKVDGFRFDLMGHIMKSTMVKARSTLQSLSKDKDGVDGPKIYIYGEGWDFGEIAKNKRGINASQFNISGTGIGSFNDRMRDAVLGGSPFGHPLQQGFVTGLSLEPNGYDHGDKSVTDRMLSSSADHIQVGLAANLRDFVLTNHEGKAMKGSEVLTHDGVPVGYALSPTETVNYVSAHDNETLFDIVSLKTVLELCVDDRCRMNHLASSLVALSQGIPFFHSGDELLRSKSLDRDSYNSGDWFNRLDFSYESNNWGVGLPPREKNEKNWPLIKPRLANPSFKPHKHHILAAVDNFVDLLKIRYSSPLFRLRTANAIQERVRFHNTGPSWVPGAIVMSVEDGHEGRPGMAQLDPIYSYIVIVFNACPTEISLQIPALKSRMLQLHPVQLKLADELVKESSYKAASGCFTIPRRTTSVFVEVRGA
ncbi:pullulanase 1, chloroplastic isoform X1 [Elaeis guineensis]|uniref:Pullulanase 1, chloroplastic isoform X2 n=1 Tax=Elaeis guineensis var. tenera TaxID=51953 RepID=A0A6I9R3A9_ELAGV|nr:pullulanase 1, chloroplastic isoform X2 [Elaeis guineensis]